MMVQVKAEEPIEVEVVARLPERQDGVNNMKKLFVFLLVIAVLSCTASATVTNENRKISYVVDGTSEFTFAYTFDIIAPDDVSITFFDANGAEVSVAMARTIDSTPAVNEYYVNESSSSILIGGAGTLHTQYETTIVQLLITRTVNSTQESAFPIATSLQSTAIETALDKNVMLVQQLSETITRALVIPIQDDSSQVVDLPPAAERANQFLAFDGLGNPAVGDSPAGGAIISTTMQPFISAATLAAARTLLEVGTTDDVEFAGITGTTGTFSGIVTGAKGSLLASSDAPTTDAMIANKKYVDDQLEPAGDSPVNRDSNADVFVKAHAYLAQTFGWVTAYASNASANILRGYVGNTDDPAGVGSQAQVAQTDSKLPSIAFPVASGKYFEITLDVQNVTIRWTPLIAGGAAPIDQD